MHLNGYRVWKGVPLYTLRKPLFYAPVISMGAPRWGAAHVTRYRSTNGPPLWGGALDSPASADF